MTGQIRYVNFSDRGVARQSGVRPALVIQNDKGCKYSPRIWVIPLTTKSKSRRLPMHIPISKTRENGLAHDSIALVEQADFVLREDIGDLVGDMEEENMYDCGRAWVNNCTGMFAPEIISAI